MNFLVSYINQSPPIKVARSPNFSIKNSVTDDNEQTECFKKLVQIFGTMPLLTSKVSFNPVLFRDPVSVTRRKYKILG